MGERLVHAQEVAGSSPVPATKIAVCIASGPSLTRADVEYTRGRVDLAIVANTSFRLAPWADVLMAPDSDWWAEHGPEAARFEGTVLRHAPKLVQAADTGTKMIEAAVGLGMEKIALLGYDMQNTDGEAHWHGDHPEPMRNPRDFAHWIHVLRRLAPKLAARGVRVVNCTRRTALDCFDRAAIEDVL